MGTAFSIALQAIVVLLFAIGIAAFVSLVKGCFVLRQMARDRRPNYNAALLKSPMVPVASFPIPRRQRPSRLQASIRFSRRDGIAVNGALGIEVARTAQPTVIQIG